MSVIVNGRTTVSTNITGLSAGTYSVSMTATSTSLPSSRTSTENVDIVPLPNTPDVTIGSVTATSISLSWTSGGTGVTYEVEWERDTTGECSDEDSDSVTIAAGSTSYVIMPVEEDSMYTVTVNATNTIGSVSDSRMATTPEAAPSALPSSIETSSDNSTSITVSWGPVEPCIDRNGDITGYSVRYGVKNGNTEDKAVSGGGTTQTTILGLEAGVTYSIQVAAVTGGNLIGVYSTPMDAVTQGGVRATVVSVGVSSISISWSLDTGLTATTSYTIQYSLANTNCFTQSYSDITGISGTSHTLTGLEEYTEYTITVSGTVTGDRLVQSTVSTATSSATPSAAPSGITLRVQSSTNIIVEWGPVEPCRDRNGLITGYSVRYNETETVNIDGDIRMANITGLRKETEYRVEVAGVTIAGTGVYSNPISITTPDNVFLSLNERVIPNYGYVDIEDVRMTDATALLCHTNNLSTPNAGGDWFAPDGTRVSSIGSSADVPGLSRNRGVGLVRLIRRSTGTPPEGIYRCSVDDATDTNQDVYVGLYPNGRGVIEVSTDPVSSVTDGEFILTCISTGGPATNVTWTYSSGPVIGPRDTVLNDPVGANYTHTLTVTAAGLYTCIISNTVSSNMATISLKGPSSPSGLTLVQEGLTTIIVSWTPSTNAEGYRIDYGSDDSQVVDKDTTTVTLTDLENGQTYTISVVAIAANRPTSSPISNSTTLVPLPSVPVIDEDSAEATASTIAISWSLPANVTMTEVTWRLAGSSRRRRRRNADGGSMNTTETSYTITGLRPSTEYEIQIVYYNAAGPSPPQIFTKSTTDSTTRGPSSGGNSGAVAGGIIAVIVVAVVIVIVVIGVIWFMRRRNTISKYEPADSGVHYSSKSDKVTAADGAPQIIDFPEDTRVQEGEGVVFKIEVTGTPRPKLVWYHDGMEVVADYSQEVGEDGTLTLPSAETKHSGVYQLIAKNRGGRTEKEVKLEVEREGVDDAIVEPNYESVTQIGPIPVTIFGGHVEQKHSKNNKPFKDEYEGLPNFADKSTSIAMSSDNKTKNRFANICVYDDNRVVLRPIAHYDTDYVNASYIDGYSSRKKFIATQGPLPKTMVDFWRLVWQEKTPTIVMITNLVEGTKIKCQQYWPESGAQEFGPFQVTITDQQILADYTKRALVVQPKGASDRPFKVTQFHFTSWPDHGVPDYASPLLAFHKRVLKEHKSGPILVHCSAGVGRTGTFITIDRALEQVEKEQKVEIPGTVTNLREQRTKMVQTLDQYIFIHDAVLEAVTCGDTQIESGDLRKALAGLQRRDQSGKTVMELQFAVLEQVSPNPADAKVTVARKHPKKNRSKDFLPLDKWRVLMKGETPDYISASIAHGYKQQRAFIIGQNPLQSTVRDFWKILCDRKCGVIVMLCDLVESGKETCYQYWPSSGSLSFGEFTVEVLGEEKLNGFNIRNFGIYNSKTQKSHQLSQFHITNWSPDGNCSNIKTVTDVIEEVSKVQRRTGNHPIMVHCSDTVSRSGMFCAIATTIERCKTEGVVDVFQVVKALRVQKPGAVRTVLQYKIIFDAVLEYLDSFALYSNF